MKNVSPVMVWLVLKGIDTALGRARPAPPRGLLASMEHLEREVQKRNARWRDWQLLEQRMLKALITLAFSRQHNAAASGAIGNTATVAPG